MAEQGSSTNPPVLTQTAYKESPYRDQNWEVVGERLEATEFESMAMEVVDQGNFGVDPMFADYGGIPVDKQGERYHIPEGANPAEARPRRKAEERLEAQVPSIPETEVQLMLAEAIEKAKQETRAELEAECNAKLKQQEDCIREILTDIDRQLKERTNIIERAAVELSLEISRKIIGTAVDINPEYILQLVRDALQQAGASTIKKVRVSPEDMEFINVIGITKYIKEFDGTWSFEPDTSIKAGCVVETSGGEIDFQLDKAWERIREDAVKVLR